MNERGSPSKCEGDKGRVDERGGMKFWKNPEWGVLMNGRTRVKGHLPGDKAVINR